MKHLNLTILTFLTAFAFISTIPAEAQSKASTKTRKEAAKTESKSKARDSSAEKRELSDEEKEELKAAQEALKVMNTYHKGLFTRLFNSGSKADLMTLPGLGEKTADRIIAARPHESSAHVVLVKGIGVETYKKWVEARK